MSTVNNTLDSLYLNNKCEFDINKFFEEESFTTELDEEWVAETKNRVSKIQSKIFESKEDLKRAINSPIQESVSTAEKKINSITPKEYF
jgi:hypothetical protein